MMMLSGVEEGDSGGSGSLGVSLLRSCGDQERSILGAIRASQYQTS